ncbi:putative aldouronate transport system permease protein [Paenibacillus cellulosilyticus]|uniref:Putative aldouronate transport system permease protein n=1 Tax=Paenibacillus cellulosilyticus TaxID=375489 RepID=A0A2V2YH54_9BACL|nr:carbohydrate ABC transporter permease [Paenibacillus cellulosilyticus]PWV90993.1 putative aldouronate transport system permease protein [Paenibacillus cellulosilyticus]QKS45207.1 carbohydrate ABC transporter permease [Paenibacillus cellulosilyticus]
MNNKETNLWQWISHILLAVLCILCVIPFILLVSASLSSENDILSDGYRFIPKHFSFEAYDYLIGNMAMIGKAYGITVFVTLIGTTVSLMMTAMLGYALSKKDMPGHRIFSFLVFFTLLFNGGLVPTYLIYTQVFDIKNTIWALLVPGLLMNGFNVLLARSFFMNAIPAPVLESSRIDGAGEYRIFFQMVLPLSLPIMATIGLFTGIMYWNDWNNALIYITDPDLYSIQSLLNQIMQNIDALKNANSAYGAGAAAVELPGETARMAIAVIGTLPILIVYPFFQRYFVKGIAGGAVKG